MKSLGLTLVIAGLAGCPKPSAGGTGTTIDAGPTIPQAASAATVAPPPAFASEAGVDASPDSPSPVPAGPTATLTLAGQFTFDYPTAHLRARTAPRAITLASGIFEDYNGGHFPFSIEIRIVDRGVVEEARKAVPDSLFPTNDESSFNEQPGYAERKTTSGGLHGYSVSMGVEGIGQVESLFPMSPKQTLHVTCHYCCGLIPAPKLTMDEQLAACDAVVQSLRPAP